ncbi:MAG TPA: hypothetical protein VGL95_07780, partial [Acetobacteraceae bacterium]
MRRTPLPMVWRDMMTRSMIAPGERRQGVGAERRPGVDYATQQHARPFSLCAVRSESGLARYTDDQGSDESRVVAGSNGVIRSAIRSSDGGASDQAWCMELREKSAMRKFQGPAGSVSRILVEGQSLRDNLLGDPTTRAVDVYVPAGESGRGLPLLVDLVGITSSGLSHTNWTGFRENVPERLDRLIGEQRMPPVVVAFPDCFTRLGGNQYVNSV